MMGRGNVRFITDGGVMSDHQFGQFDSWEILNESIARKTCDSSFFKYHGSGVPQDIRWFFDVEELPLGASEN